MFLVMNNGDQLELFSKKQLRDAWFTDADVEANTKHLEVLSDQQFKK